MAEVDPILEAAGAMLDEGGELTMGALAERAGVSRGTVYRRFGDRARVLAALAEARGVTVAALGADVRSRALDAVGALVAERGLSGMSVEAVAQRAGLGAATIYRHFVDRRGLLQAFAAQRSPRRLLPRVAAGGEAGEVLVEVVGELIGFVRDNPALVRLLFADDPESRGLLGAMRAGPRMSEALAGYFAGEVEAGRLWGEPRAMAAALAGMVLGLAQFGGGDELGGVEGQARWVVSLFLDGCRVTEGVS